MACQDLINTCVFEQFQGLLFSDLSGPLSFISACEVKATDNNILVFWNMLRAAKPTGHITKKFLFSIGSLQAIKQKYFCKCLNKIFI